MSYLDTPNAIKTAKDGLLSHRINTLGETLHPLDLLASPLNRAAALADLLESIASENSEAALAPDTLQYTAQAISYEIQDTIALLKSLYGPNLVENGE